MRVEATPPANPATKCSYRMPSKNDSCGFDIILLERMILGASVVLDSLSMC